MKNNMLRAAIVPAFAAILLAGAICAGNAEKLSPVQIPTSQPHGHATIGKIDMPGWGPATGSWRLGIFLPKKIHDVGEEVVVVVVMQNVSGREIKKDLPYFDVRLRFEVDDIVLQDREKARAEKRLEAADFPFIISMLDVRDKASTRYGDYHTYGAGISPEGGWPRSLSWPVIIPPNHCIIRWIRLNALWDVTLPTEYRVVAKAQSGTQAGGEIWDLKSNAVSFSVKDFGFLHWARAAGHKE